MKIFLLTVGATAGATTDQNRAEEYARQNPGYKVTEVELDAPLCERWETPWGDVDCFVEKPPVDTGPVLFDVPDFMKKFAKPL